MQTEENNHNLNNTISMQLSSAMSLAQRSPNKRTTNRRDDDTTVLRSEQNAMKQTQRIESIGRQIIETNDRINSQNTSINSHLNNIVTKLQQIDTDRIQDNTERNNMMSYMQQMNQNIQLLLKQQSDGQQTQPAM